MPRNLSAGAILLGVKKFSGNGAITCGAFTALPLSPYDWRITCSQLKGWSEQIRCHEEEAAQIVIKLQAEFRESWEVLPK